MRAYGVENDKWGQHGLIIDEIIKGINDNFRGY